MLTFRGDDVSALFGHGSAFDTIVPFIVYILLLTILEADSYYRNTRYVSMTVTMSGSTCPTVKTFDNME